MGEIVCLPGAITTHDADVVEPCFAANGETRYRRRQRPGSAAIAAFYRAPPWRSLTRDVGCFARNRNPRVAEEIDQRQAGRAESTKSTLDAFPSCSTLRTAHPKGTSGAGHGRQRRVTGPGSRSVLLFDLRPTLTRSAQDAPEAPLGRRPVLGMDAQQSEWTGLRRPVCTPSARAPPAQGLAARAIVRVTPRSSCGRARVARVKGP